ncbi:hypothetical protein NLI96_g9525 [Meripilus lineatus]|uniref:Uncharacterized protein n=1 Tax=Meripilus lineatus TaxID=2056292 RepID=A0AAD5UVJ4_9APHY|nr:hypothetical protein NLI96_g9525 [Physisporinus lineatus]
MEQDHIRRIYESFQKRADPEEYLLVRLQNLLEKAIHRVPEDVTSEAFSNFDGDFKGCLRIAASQLDTTSLKASPFVAELLKHEAQLMAQGGAVLIYPIPRYCSKIGVTFFFSTAGPT